MNIILEFSKLDINDPYEFYDYLNSKGFILLSYELVIKNREKFIIEYSKNNKCIVRNKVIFKAKTLNKSYLCEYVQDIINKEKGTKELLIQRETNKQFKITSDNQVLLNYIIALSKRIDDLENKN